MLAQPSRPGVPAAREALRGHQRLGQAQQLVHLGRAQTNLLDPGETPMDEPAASCVFLTRASSRRSMTIRTCCACRVASRRQRPPLGRERGPAGHHLDLPGRRAGEHRGRAHRRRHAVHTSRDKVAMDLGVAVLPNFLEGHHRPQPHQPLRLYRQQVRVPHAGLEREPVRLQHGPQHRRGEERSRTSPTPWRARRDGVRGGAPLRTSRDLLVEHKRIIFNGDGYSEEWPRRGRAPRPVPTTARPPMRCRASSSREEPRAVRGVRRALASPRCAAATR